jgi:PAS domain S-box-containing protein
VLRLRRADGEFRWHNVRYEPLRDQQGRIIQWYGLSVDIDEGKKTEEWPRFVTELQAILNVLPAYSWYGTPSGSLTFVNKRQADFLGVPKDHPLRFGVDVGAKWDDWIPLLHPDDHEGARKYWSNLLRTGEGGEHDYRVRNAQGDYRWFLTRAEPLRASDGTLLLWIGTTLDIEELKCTEQALRESEHRLRQIIETVPSLLWSSDPAGEPVQLNQRLLDYSGMRFEDFKQGGWEAFLHPDDFPETARAFDHAIQTGTSYEAVNRLRRADGKFRWHHTRGEPLRDSQGRIVQWYGVSIDIDAAKKAEDLLRRSEAHLAEAQRLSHIGATAANKSKVLYFSEEAYRIWGFDPALGIPSFEMMSERLHPDDRDRVLAGVQFAFAEKRGYSHEYRIRLPDGTVKHIESIGEPVLSASGELFEVVATQIDVTKRKRAEEDLRESEHKLRQIFETVPGLLWSTDTSGEPTQLNQRFLDYTGLRFEDFMHGGWEAFLHPDDFSETARAFDHAIQTGTSYQTLHRLRRADGEFRWHHTRGEPLRDPQGRIVQWYGLSFDIDEGKRAADLLGRSEAHLAEAQKLSHTGSASYNDTKVLYWSDETYRIFEFDPLEGLPSREAVQQRIHPDDRERARKEARRAVEQKRDYKLEYRAELPGGTIKYIEVIAHPKFSASGELVEVVSTLIDVTERNCAEQALRESEGKFRDYAETASDWFWEVGQDYKFTLLTENAFGLHAADRIGTAFWEHALDLESESDKWRLIWAALDARKPFRDLVYRVLGGNGSPMYVKASGKPVFDRNGEFRGYCGTGTDVTALVLAQEEHEKLRRLESDLAHMNRLTIMGELAASLAHEIAQPIATARNNARAAMHFLNRNPPDLGEIREALACIVDDADRAGDIIDRMRDHIKKAPPRKSRFDLNKAIDEVIGLARSTINTNGVSVRTHFTHALLPVEGDRVQLQQVVLNLTLNAVEAMSTLEAGPRELLISTEQTQTGVVLVSVGDSGPGIDPDHLERIFQTFYTTKSSGLGMGLSICRSIIDAHGGRLWAEANVPRGAVLRFSLPGAGRELTNSRRSAHLTEEPHADTVSDAAHQTAYEGNKRPHRP